MSELSGAWAALKFGGAMVYPLLFLGALALTIMLDRGLICWRMLRLPRRLVDLIETYEFSWTDLEQMLDQLVAANAYRRFFGVITANRDKPAWWVESRAGDEAGVTAAPLMGLLGTITGMMQAFRVIGGAGLVAPTQVTAGVAQALIATALGLLIAILALFGFNFFSRVQTHALDLMERLGTRLTDHIRLDESGAETPALAPVPSREGRAGR
jgi:biopolymer transport protein ExbB